MIDSFLDDAPRLMTQLGQAIEVSDTEATRRLAHGLKSNCSDMGAPALAELCKELEATAKAGALDGAPELFARINMAYPAIETALKRVRETGKIEG